MSTRFLGLGVMMLAAFKLYTWHKICYVTYEIFFLGLGVMTLAAFNRTLGTRFGM